MSWLMGDEVTIFLIFLVIVIALCIRFSVRPIFRKKKPNTNTAPGLTRGTARRPSEVRRTAVYTISADPRANDPANDFTDFFWDGGPNASSLRNEPAKEDKDLPTYEEVMRLGMTQQAIGSTTVTPANINTTTSSVVGLPVIPVIPVVAASTT